MTNTLKTRDGKLILIDGKILVGEEGSCCCDSDAPTCCYNDQCQVVPCNDPSVIGSVADCDPCSLNFCGFCKPSEPTSQPIDQTENYPYVTQANTYDLCRFVEPLKLESEVDGSGTLYTNGGNTRLLAQSRQPNSVVTTARVSLALSGSNLTYSVDGFAGVGIGTFTPPSTVDFGVGLSIAVGVVSGATWEGSVLTTLDNITVTRIGTTGCSFAITGDYSIAYSLKITNPDNSVPLDISDTQSGSLSSEFTSATCDPGSFTTNLQADLVSPITGTPSVIDAVSFARIFASQKTFVQTLPTCAS